MGQIFFRQNILHGQQIQLAKRFSKYRMLSGLAQSSAPLSSPMILPFGSIIKVVGRLTTPNLLLACNCWSSRTGKVRLLALIKGSTICAPNISLETASREKFLDLKRWCRVSNEGISTLQGPHQVAQKFTRTYFPLC